MTTFSVAGLYTMVREMVSTCFPELFWIQGEIHELSRSSRGHVYFRLKDDQHTNSAAIAVTLFDDSRLLVNQQILRAGAAMRMKDGVRVRIQGALDVYAPRSLIQMRMVAIDPEFTMGAVASTFTRHCQLLESEGIADRQRQLNVPAQPLRVGLITSLGSAAHADFIHETRSIASPHHVIVHDAIVQGIEAPAAIRLALTKCVLSEVDLIAIVRGGGARTDLGAFDDLDLARAIANCPIPVWTGIGHEVDTTVVDFAANRSFKTPTACAAELMRHGAQLANELTTLQHRLTLATDQYLSRSVGQLDSIKRAIVRAGLRSTAEEGQALGTAQARLRGVGRALESQRLVMQDLESRFLAHHPHRVLERGYAILRPRGPVGVGDSIEIETMNQIVHATVSSIAERNPS